MIRPVPAIDVRAFAAEGSRSGPAPAGGTDEGADAPRRSRLGSRLRMCLLVLAVLVTGYLGALAWLFSVFHDRNLFYPQNVLALYAPPGDAAPAIGDPSSGAQETCEGSRIVAMQVHLIDWMVNRNAWVPAHPLYKFGFFGIVSFEDTPWFDNKASAQIGVLDIVRRTGIELTDTLGRVRGTSRENPELSNAQSTLRIDEHAWYVNNPFSGDINTISPSASDAYRRAIPLYEQYNSQLELCKSVYDVRADNLRETLSRYTATLGATTSELEARSKELIYDPETDAFVRGAGNDRGWFDMHADNHFYRARGKMFALHGLLQGMREDFRSVLVDRNVLEVWDKMEASIAEAAALEPLVVSNGAADGMVLPDHLSVMAEIILRARTSMVEVRDILDN